MDQFKAPAQESLTLESRAFENNSESQLPVDTEFANVSNPTHQAAAMVNADDIDGAQTMNHFGAHTAEKQLAQAALEYRPKNHQAFKMESIKALLQNVLDGLREPQNEHSSNLDRLLSQWLDIWREDRSHAFLIYVLGDGSEQYEHQRLAFGNLGTIDKMKTNILEQQCSQQGACLHLAKMTSTMGVDPDDALELKMAISLDEIHNLNGGLLVDKPVIIGRESVVQKGLLKTRYQRIVTAQDPYPSPSEGSPDLESDTSRTFHDWVLVIMPEGHRFRFLAENADPLALHEWIETELADLQLSGIDPTNTDRTKSWGIALACKIQLKNIGRWIASDLNRGDIEGRYRQSNLLETIVCVSLRLRDPEIFEEAITTNPRMLSLAKWEEVGSAMEPAQFMLYRNSLNEALTQIDSFQDRYIILDSIRQGFAKQSEQQESKKTVENWCRDQIEQALNDTRRVEENDGAILVVVAKKFAEAINMYRIVTFAKSHSSNYKFAIEFAFSLYDGLVQNTMDAGQAKYLLGEFLSTAVPTLCLRSPQNWSLRPWLPYLTFMTSPQDQQSVHADRMARLLRCCIVARLYNEEHTLLRHYWLDVDLADAFTLQHVFLPYLKHLLSMMHDYSIPLTTPTYQWQFQQVMSNFILRYIGLEPTKPPADFTCPPLGCAGPTRPYGCGTCLELDAFLVDPHRQTADIEGGIDASEHIAARIQETDYLQMTVMSHSAENMTSIIRITKNKARSEEPDARHDLWRDRVIKANDLIQAICGDEQWKLLLGDRYDECMGLKAVIIR